MNNTAKEIVDTLNDEYGQNIDMEEFKLISTIDAIDDKLMYETLSKAEINKLSKQKVLTQNKLKMYREERDKN